MSYVWERPKILAVKGILRDMQQYVVKSICFADTTKLPRWDANIVGCFSNIARNFRHLLQFFHMYSILFVLAQVTECIKFG